MSVSVFVDGAYLDKLLELNFNMAKIDYSAFVNHLVEEQGDKVDKVYYYHCPPHLPYNPTDFEKDRYNNKMRFFGALKNLNNFETRLGRLVFRGTSKDTGKPIFVQKRVTTYLATDFLTTVYREENDIVLIAGDSEYVPLVESATADRCNVSLWHGVSQDRNNNMVHKSLHDACTDTYEITQAIVDQCLR